MREVKKELKLKLKSLISHERLFIRRFFKNKNMVYFYSNRAFYLFSEIDIFTIIN